MERETLASQRQEWLVPRFKVILVTLRGRESWWILWRPKVVRAPFWRFQRLMAGNRLEALQAALRMVLRAKVSVSIGPPSGRRWPEKAAPPVTTEADLPKVAKEE